MFTGIIEDIGEIKSLKRKSKEATISIIVNKIDASQIELGESISVNGTCLTVISTGVNYFTVDVSGETLSRTNLSKLTVSSKINLERSLKAGSRMGGHIVTGHIDGVGVVKSIIKRGKSIEVWFSLPKTLSKYIVQKGSIAVDGVSLTVNLVDANNFSVNIIPHTQNETIFSALKLGNEVNIECDIIGKYVEKFVMIKDKNNNSSFELLEKL